jgi:hypothetical protein
MKDSDVSYECVQNTGIEIREIDSKNHRMRGSNTIALVTITTLLSVASEGCRADDVFLAAAAPKNIEQSSAVQQLPSSGNSPGQSFSKGLSGQSYAKLGYLLETEHTGVSLKSPGQPSNPRFAFGLAELEKADNSMRPKTLEDVARRFHREGLPVARLWQTESTALSLGLNNKGKPGLWFVKKLH